MERSETSEMEDLLQESSSGCEIFQERSGE